MTVQPELRPATRHGTDLTGRRIAVVNWKDPWHPDAGGAEVYAWQVALDLVAAGARVTFVTARPAGQAPTEAREGIEIVRTGGRWTIYPRVLAWLLRRRRAFDAVIDCQNGIPFFSPLVLPRTVPVVCVIHHVHDRQFRLYFGPLVGRFGAWLEGPVARRVYRGTVTLAVSPSTSGALRDRLGWTAPVLVVPNGADGSEPEPPGTSRTGTAADRTGPEPDVPVGTGRRPGHPRLICVGRVTRHKRVDLVLDAVDRLRDRRPDVRLDIVGGGPDLALIRGLVTERGLDGHVTVHGHLPAAQRDALVEEAWLHVAGSWGEGWGLVVLEAARAGLPTVAFDVDGLRDAIRPGRTGWLVSEGTDPAGDLTSALDRAIGELADPERAERMAVECRRWSESFRWSESGERIRAVLADLLGRRAVPWAADSACILVRTADPDELRLRLEPLLPRTRHVAVGDGWLWLLVPAAEPVAVRDLLARAGVPGAAVTQRVATAQELLTGIPDESN